MTTLCQRIGSRKNHNVLVVPPEEYVANPLNALGILKRTGHDFYNDFQPVVELYFNETEGLAKIRNLTAIFPDIYAFADACSSVSLLQVNVISDRWVWISALSGFTDPK